MNKEKMSGKQEGGGGFLISVDDEGEEDGCSQVTGMFTRLVTPSPATTGAQTTKPAPQQ